MSRFVTCSRMYNAAPSVREGWTRLFGSVFDALGLNVDIIEHAWPEPIESLWRRPDLLCGFMCGWPFINSTLPMKALAVPVPSPSRYQGLSRYCSEFLVRGDSNWSTLQQSFGHRFGYMTENSQSGFNAPRAALAPFAAERAGTLFEAVVGPLDTPARALSALRRGEVDLIALDSFYLDLLRAHRPESLEGVMTLTCTAFTAMPLLVASDNVPDDTAAALASELKSLHLKAQFSELLADVLVQRFATPDIARYRALNDGAATARQLGYQVMR